MSHTQEVSHPQKELAASFVLHSPQHKMATKAAPAIGNQETQIQRAIAALENGECESICSAAKEFGVLYLTLQECITRNCQT